MNAYELADELEGFNFLDGDIPLAPYQKQADMLREQADRIVELEKALNWIATVNAMDYEYQDVAKTVLKQEEINVL